jgi:predicted dehydrogenase
MSDRLRLIQCGVGGFGESWLRDVVLHSPDFQLVAIVDPNPVPRDAARALARLVPEHCFASLDDALRRAPTDAVLSVTPPAAHLEHARSAFAAGLHLMVEKPIADAMPAAVEMVRLAEQSGRQLVVSQNYRYSAPAMHLRRRVSEGKLGRIGHGHVDFYIPADFTGTFRQEMRHVLLVDMAIHHIDLIRHITGLNILEVTAASFRPGWSWYDHESALKMLLRLEQGVWFTYSGDWSATGRRTGWSGEWRIQTHVGSIHWNADGVEAALSGRGFEPEIETHRLQCPPTERSDRAATLASFAAAIRSGVPAPTSGRDNLQSFAAVMAAMLSAEEKRTVSISELLGG